MNTAAQPFFGPPVRVGTVLGLSKQLYLVRDYNAGGLTFMRAKRMGALKQLNSFYGNVGAATGMGGGPNDHGETMQDQLLKAVLDMSGILGGASNPYGTAAALRKERVRHR